MKKEKKNLMVLNIIIAEAKSSKISWNNLSGHDQNYTITMMV